MDDDIGMLFDESPAVRLMRSRLGAFVAGFLFKTFKAWNVLEASEEELGATLAEHLEQLREHEGADAPKRLPSDYLDEWCDEEHRYLTKSYSEEREEYVFRLTRHSQKALNWLQDLMALQRRGYATTESRFNRILFQMRELSQGVNSDPEARIQELIAKRNELDEEIKRIRETGEAPIFGEDMVRDNVHDLADLIENFLSDFRAIEEFFKEHAREISRLYAAGDASKGDIVERTLDADDELRACDQGKSYFGFRSMMTDPVVARDLRKLIDEIGAIARQRGFDSNQTFRSFADRLFGEAAAAQGAYGRISRKLRQVVGDHVGSGGQQIRDSLSLIRQGAFRLRENPPEDWEFEIETRPVLYNFLELDFWEPKAVEPFGLVKTATSGDAEWINELLHSVGEPLELTKFRERVNDVLEEKEQVSLTELVERYPLEHGIVDIVCYRVVASEDSRHLLVPDQVVKIDLNREQQPRYTEVQQLLFQRELV
ncbi:MAG: DUF3375 family protein [Opitutae bacterium]|nr:DUF3375 family protein [Opitutae bacterium]MBT6850113.1 DUF3375 family protein [Opitutae bacterium]MBT7740717.1 DUF3375 family protein [Opitutae bacterium]